MAAAGDGGVLEAAACWRGGEPVALHVERAETAVQAGLSDRITLYHCVMHDLPYPDEVLGPGREGMERPVLDDRAGRPHLVGLRFGLTHRGVSQSATR